MSGSAVLFDLGDVLVRLRFGRGLARLTALVGGDPSAAVDATALYLGERSLAYSRGELAPEEFFRGLLARLGGPDVSLEHAAAAWCDIFDPWPEMEALAAEVLAAGHAAYLLSNTDPVHFEHLRGRVPVLSRLTGLHLSYEVGLTKPDPGFFRAALARFGLEPAACAFVDDRPENVEAATSVGIPSLVHRGDVGEVRAFLCAQGVRLA